MSRALLLAALSLAFGCNTPAAAEPPAQTAQHGPRRFELDPETVKRLGIVAHQAGAGASLATVSLPGSIEYDLERYAEVGPRLDGRITSVKVKLGDRVKKGDLLAELAVPSLAEAQAAFLTANATLAAAKKNATRERDLLAKQLTTAREAEVAEADLSKAEAEAKAARARLDALGAGGTGIGGTIRLVSPIEGTIVARQAVIGAFLAMSANAFVVADTSELMATLEAHESDLPELKVDSDVSFVADGLPGRTFKGKLTYVDPTVSKTTRLVRARVKVPNPDGLLRPGMFVRAALALSSSATGVKNAITLPPEAVQPLGNDDVAFVEIAPGKYEVRTLVIARRTSEVVEVTGGISKGEAIVTEGAFLLRGEAAKR